MSRARFIGVGVSEYDKGYPRLDHALPDVEAIAEFDRNWVRYSGGPVPAWLTVGAELLGTAQAWVATDTYSAERDHLATHPVLLEPAADIAVAEALLTVGKDEAARYARLRQAAQCDGADAAYRPLLLAILAHEFADADPDRQRTLLAARRDDLLTDIVSGVLNELAGQEDGLAAAAQQASALIDLARSGGEEVVFDALGDPEQFPGLLHALTTRSNPAGLTAAALVAANCCDLDRPDGDCHVLFRRRHGDQR